MKQYEAVIRVMEENGGFATLAFLNQRVLKIPGCEWKTKTPFASIRRIVQDKRFFFKVRPGLWALKSYEDRLPEDVKSLMRQTGKQQDEYTHAYYQGLLLEIGNFENMMTYVSAQDKNKSFLGKKLSDVATIPEIYDFGYPELIQIAKNIDVVWFNERKMPCHFFEIEHTTDIRNSLIKFTNLQDFYVKFRIVADEHRKEEFESKRRLDLFGSIRDRVEFISYDRLAKYHDTASKYFIAKKRIPL